MQDQATKAADEKRARIAERTTRQDLARAITIQAVGELGPRRSSPRRRGARRRPPQAAARHAAAHPPHAAGPRGSGTARRAAQHMSTQRKIFLDTETTGLDPRHHRIWDLAYIIRDQGKDDVEAQWYINVPLDEAYPFALRVGHFWQRHPLWGGHDGSYAVLEAAVARQVAMDFRDAIVVGAVPWFDTNMLTELLHRNHGMPTWHYHLIDVETLAAGAASVAPPWNFNTVLDAFGLTYREEDRHTAIGDARMVRDLYDAVMGAGQAHTDARTLSQAIRAVDPRL